MANKINLWWPALIVLGCTWILPTIGIKKADLPWWFFLCVVCFWSVGFVTADSLYDWGFVSAGDWVWATGRLGWTNETPRAPSRPSGAVGHGPDQLGGRLNVRGAEPGGEVNVPCCAPAAAHRRGWAADLAISFLIGSELMDLQRAITFIKLNGDLIERARISSILWGETPSEKVLEVRRQLGAGGRRAARDKCNHIGPGSLVRLWTPQALVGSISQ